MIAFAPTVARLKAAGFTAVEGLLEFAGLAEAPRVDRALFIVPEREAAAPNRMSGVHDQKITETFTVVLVVQSGRATSVVSEALQVESRAIEQALGGWTHPDASGPCELAGARLVSVEAQRVAWGISFSVPRHFRKDAQ